LSLHVFIWSQEQVVNWIDLLPHLPEMVKRASVFPQPLHNAWTAICGVFTTHHTPRWYSLWCLRMVGASYHSRCITCGTSQARTKGRNLRTYQVWGIAL